MKKFLSVAVLMVWAVVAGAADKPFYFVQISDTHWGARDGAAMTRRAVELLNKLPVKIEFVAVTGDITSDAIKREEVVQEGLEAMKQLKVPVYYVPGNHDIQKTDPDTTAKLFEKYFGPLNQKVEIRGVMCLFLNTELLKGETRSPAAVQRIWLEQALGSGKKAKPTLIFMHRPPVPDVITASAETATWTEDFDPRWEQLLESHPEIKGVFAGHFHRDELHWLGQVPVFVAPAIARFWDRQPALRLFELKDGRIHYWTLYPEYTSSRRPGQSQPRQSQRVR